MSVSDKIEEIKDYYHIGEWLEHAIKNKQDLPEILNTIWNKHGAMLVSELESLAEQIDSLNEQSFKGFSDLVQNKGKLTQLKSTHMAVELQLTNVRREIGKRVFERKDELENVSDELDQLFVALEGVLEHSALEDDFNSPCHTGKKNNSSWSGEYKTGIILSKIIAISGWVSVVAGIIIAIISLFTISSKYGGFSMMTLIPALSTVFGGLLLVSFSQLFRSIMENTNNTREILVIMRKKQVQDDN